MDFPELGAQRYVMISFIRHFSKWPVTGRPGPFPMVIMLGRTTRVVPAERPLPIWAAAVIPGSAVLAFVHCASELVLGRVFPAVPQQGRTQRSMLHIRPLPLIALLMLGLLWPQAAQGIAHATNTLRVGVAGSSPFINPDGSGISMDLWNEATEVLGWNYTTRTYPTVAAALEALQAGEVDAVAGPVAITADHAARVSLTQPYFRSSLSILSRKDELDVQARIRPFFSKRLAYAVGVFLCILASVGALLWLAERKRNEQFPPRPARGIANGMWCAIVTMTTTGYGDVAPKTFLGRVIAGAWMVISLLFATSMVAGIASTLTLTGMDRSVVATADQFPGKRVAVLEGAAHAKFVTEHGGTPVAMPALDSCYAALQAHRVDAVLFDRPQLLYFQQETRHADLAISAEHYLPEGYGFAFRTDAAQTPLMDVVLLRMMENGAVDKVVKDWLGPLGTK